MSATITIDLQHDRLVKVSKPEIPGLDPKFWPSPKSLRRWIQLGRLAALLLPGCGLVTSLEALTAAGLIVGKDGAPSAPPPARVRSTAQRKRERAARTEAILKAEGLA